MKTKIFFITLLFYVTFVNCASPKNDKNLSSNQSSPDITKADSNLLLITGLVLSQIDFIACIFVIVRTYLQWKKNGKNPLPMSLRFPFYLELIELSVSVLQTANFSRLTAYRGIGSGHLCSLVGIFSMFLLGFSTNLVTFVTFVVWYKVKRNVDFNSGRYDYILLISSSGLSIFYTLLGVGEYGPSNFWCSIQPRKRTILYMILAILIIHTSILLVLYFNTRINLIRLNVNQSSLGGLSERDLIISRRITSYTLPIACRLIILLLCAIVAAAVKSENPAVHLFRMLGVTIGGLLIALQYIINEGWKLEPTSPSLVGMTGKNLSLPATMASSIRSSIQRLPFTRIQVEVVQQQTTTQQSDIWSI